MTWVQSGPGGRKHQQTGPRVEHAYGGRYGRRAGYGGRSGEDSREVTSGVGPSLGGSPRPRSLRGGQGHAGFGTEECYDSIHV